MVKSIILTLDDSVFNKLKELKKTTKKTSWEEFFRDAVKATEIQRKGVN